MIKDIGWIRKDQGFSAGFDKDFADFIYKNKVGSIDVVETAFGFHIISVDDQTDPQKAVKLVTYARLIEASEETENNVFEQAEKRGFKNLAFPAIGASFPGLDPKMATEIIVEQAIKSIDEKKGFFTQVFFIVCDSAPYVYFKKMLTTRI